ncbi:hypothetical protein UFOVP450_106 [uncultured Caudovirales phage]|uniref:Uncharacterized protein n=1 Tax=uncultured Caudovirales phage TaxID=2100421 RepID=A0A6J5M8G8_9CAUD|nr:hypothetical protein UFOVP450_106 [uncultured Caudovirales phage]
MDIKHKTTMNKYRKKPVVIEALQFTRNNWEEIQTFTQGQAHTLTIERRMDGKCTCIIPTLEGEHIANEGDWIIKGVQGEYYPCKPDIFEQTYEKDSHPQVVGWTPNEITDYTNGTALVAQAKPFGEPYIYGGPKYDG